MSDIQQDHIVQSEVERALTPPRHAAEAVATHGCHDERDASVTKHTRLHSLRNNRRARELKRAIGELNIFLLL
jgi:hypothetical protein